MFSSNRYVTKGVHDEVEQDIQQLLWSIIDVRKNRGDTMDYLQVFELFVEVQEGRAVQKVCNRQEQPYHQETITFKSVERPIQTTIWVIDSGDYCTMLYPHEY